MFGFERCFCLISEAVGGSVADLRSKKKGSLTSLSKLKASWRSQISNSDNPISPNKSYKHVYLT